jgi:dipeptidase
VAQLRNWLPNPIGGVLWGGLAAAWANAHVPWYSGITRTPAKYNVGTVKSSKWTGGIDGWEECQSEYDDNSAYWIYETLTNLTNLFYRNTIDEVQPVWEDWENRLFEMQPIIEKTAFELYKKDKNHAIEFLTSYSNCKGIEALDMAKSMIFKLLTIIARRSSGYPGI